MTEIKTKEQFLAIWEQTPDFDTGAYTLADTHPKNGRVVIYFTASWCGPCKRIDKSRIVAAASANGIPFWICADEVCDYPFGWLSVTSIPSFLVCGPKYMGPKIMSSNTDDIIRWITSAEVTAKFI